MFFCEGIPDRGFYSLVVDEIPAVRAVPYTLVTASEVDAAGSDGKSVLVALFRHFGQDINTLSRRVRAVYLMDKDIDDWLGIAIKDKSVVYTDGYSFEN